jgi:hypothetical protein
MRASRSVPTASSVQGGVDAKGVKVGVQADPVVRVQATVDRVPVEVPRGTGVRAQAVRVPIVDSVLEVLAAFVVLVLVVGWDGALIAASGVARIGAMCLRSTSRWRPPR